SADACYGWRFFFEAEDGIRDRNVTGVQTCALPICGCFVENFPRARRPGHAASLHLRAGESSLRSNHGSGSPPIPATPARPPRLRSEERRAGKECTVDRAARAGSAKDGTIRSDMLRV